MVLYTHQQMECNLMTSQNVQIATTIVNQMGGTNRLALMIGARNFMADTNALSFRFPAHGKNKANYFKATLNAADLYDTEFGIVRGDNYKVVSTESNLYNDQLVSYFENETGLYLSL